MDDPLLRTRAEGTSLGVERPALTEEASEGPGRSQDTAMMRGHASVDEKQGYWVAGFFFN